MAGWAADFSWWSGGLMRVHLLRVPCLDGTMGMTIGGWQHIRRVRLNHFAGCVLTCVQARTCCIVAQYASAACAKRMSPHPFTRLVSVLMCRSFQPVIDSSNDSNQQMLGSLAATSSRGFGVGVVDAVCGYTVILCNRTHHKL